MIAYPSSMVRDIRAHYERIGAPTHPSDVRQLTESTIFAHDLVGARSDEKWTPKERRALDDAIAEIEKFTS